MGETILINNIKKYTKLMFLKDTNKIEFEELNGFNNDINLLKERINNELDNINDINKKYEGYGSIADALMTNSVYIEYLYIDYNDSEEIVFRNDYLDKFIQRKDIDFIKCTKFINLCVSDLIKDNIFNQFKEREDFDLDIINLYVKYFLSNNTIEEKISNINLLIDKFNKNFEKIEIDGAFLAKVLINTPLDSKLYNELEKLIKNTFNNLNTINSFNKEMKEYKSYGLPF